MSRPPSGWTPAALAAAMLVALLAAGAPAAAENARNRLVQPAKPAAAHAQRLALVVGNSSYREAPLKNPANDARAMASALQASGFEVMLHTDVDKRGFLAALREFGDRLKRGGFGVFYFAGHGMQVKGRNYLVPVGADIQREDEIAYAALDAQAVLDKMEAAGNGANLMILDACRNNPFARAFRSSNQGLAQMEAPVGTFVAFSTAPGAVASDGDGSNGLYTEHLLKAMSRPGAKIEDVFKRVRAEVRRESDGKQIPWESTSLEGDLYFIDPPAAAAPAPAPDPIRALDQALWDTVRSAVDPTEVRAYLNRFPQGMYAVEAAALVERLESARAAAPVAAAPLGAAQLPSAPGIATPPSTTVAAPDGAVAAPPPSGSLWTEEARVRRRERRLADEGGPGKFDADGRAPGATASASPAMAAPPVRGHVAGDRWDYAHIDGIRGELVRIVSRTIERVDTDGQVWFDEGYTYRTPIARFNDEMLQPRAFGHSSPAGELVWWAGMRRGDKLSVTMATKHKSGGAVVPAQLAATIEHAGHERVSVPAGQFEAIRLDIKGQLDFVAAHAQGGTRAWQQDWSERLWYVPALRGYAISEIEERDVGEGTWTNRLSVKARYELTGHVLGGSPAPQVPPPPVAAAGALAAASTSSGDK